MKKDTIENAGSPKWGLFEWNFWRHPIRWLKDLKIYRDRIKYMKKYGYSPQAEWESFIWFIDVMRNILSFYRHKRRGTAYYLDEPYESTNEQLERNEEYFNSELDKMLELLDKMDERKIDTTPATKEDYDKLREASDEFFKMFAKYFYGLWD